MSPHGFCTGKTTQKGTMKLGKNARKSTMKTGGRQGFVSFDLLFCALPLLLMLSFLVNQAGIISGAAQTHTDSQELHAKLLSIADYAVKMGGAQKENQGGGQFSGSALYRPNSIDDSELSSLPVERIRGWMELESLHIGWEKGEGACVYRIALHNGEIGKLYVCGE